MERNGKGKEYNKYGELIFEGEYLNGKRWNGKGKEYTYLLDKLLFKGEYKNGKRWNGEGKEYNRYGHTATVFRHNILYFGGWEFGKALNFNKFKNMKSSIYFRKYKKLR